MESLDFMQNYYEVTGIPILIYHDAELVRQFPEKMFEPNPVRTDFISLIEAECPACYTMSGVSMLVGLVRWENTGFYIFFGPSPLSPCSSSHCLRLLQTMGQPEERWKELSRWLHTIPVYDSIRFQNMLHFIDFTVNNISEKRIQYIDKKTEEFTVQKELIYNNSRVPVERMDSIQEMLFENQLLSLVESGNILELQKNIHILYHQNAGMDTQGLNADRYLKNIFIGSNSLACRAAIRGGLSVPIALDISDGFIAEIEACKGYDEILMFLSQMLITYTKETAESKIPENSSLLVRKTIRNIRDHIYEPLSPTDIALNLHMDLSYLCRHFKEQTGQTISSCIQEIKIKESERLLRTTGLSLVQIALQLGFSSQNYFHSIFKKVTGMTPKMYRSINDE